MADVRQVPLDEYESMKKSYGFTDDQMKSIVGIEPFAKRWADGYGESRKEVDEVKLKHQKLVEEINKKLKNQTSSSENSKKESAINKVVEEIKVKESKPLFDANLATSESEKVEVKEETEVFDVPQFEPIVEEVTAPTFEPVEEVNDIPVFEPIENEENIPTFEFKENSESKSFDVPSFNSVQVEENVPSFEMPVENTQTGVSIEQTETFDIPTFEPIKDDANVPTFEPVVEDTPVFEPIENATSLSFEIPVKEQFEEEIDNSESVVNIKKNFRTIC